jgi:hypothetical protein
VHALGNMTFFRVRSLYCPPFISPVDHSKRSSTTPESRATSASSTQKRKRRWPTRSRVRYSRQIRKSTGPPTRRKRRATSAWLERPRLRVSTSILARDDMVGHDHSSDWRLGEVGARTRSECNIEGLFFFTSAFFTLACKNFESVCLTSILFRDKYIIYINLAIHDPFIEK